MASLVPASSMWRADDDGHGCSDCLVGAGETVRALLGQDCTLILWGEGLPHHTLLVPLPATGVYYEPLEKGAPGEVHPEKSYTFKYPRPPK